MIYTKRRGEQRHRLAEGVLKALEEIIELQGITLRQHPPRQVFISVDIARILSETGVPGQSGKGTLTSFSLGGCGLTTSMALAVGDIIQFSFTIPEGNGPVTLTACVRRTQRGDDGILAGAEFIGLSVDTAESLLTFLAQEHCSCDKTAVALLDIP